MVQQMTDLKLEDLNRNPLNKHNTTTGNTFMPRRRAHNISRVNYLLLFSNTMDMIRTLEVRTKLAGTILSDHNILRALMALKKKKRKKEKYRIIRNALSSHCSDQKTKMGRKE